MSARLPNGFQVVCLGADAIPDCIRLAQASFDDFEARPDAMAQWFDARIVHNPWQRQLPGIGVGLQREGRLVAFRAMFAQPWWLDGRPTVIAFAAHTAVDPRYRGQGLGTCLIDASRGFADLTGSTSAGDITQKAYRRLRFHAIGGDDNSFFRVRTGYAGSLASRIGPRAGAWAGGMADFALRVRDARLGGLQGWRLEPLDRCGDEVDALWHRVRVGEVSCLERGSAYLNWRLFDQPTAPLQASAVRDAAGGLQALAVWTTLRYSPTVAAAVLRDVLAPAGDVALHARALRLLLAHWRARGASWASLEVACAPLQRLFSAQGYEHVPSKGNRYHVHAATPLPEPMLAQWHRSGLDGDYFDTRPAQGPDAP